MPPKKSVQASPAASKRNAAPSPARSTRSTRSHRNDEDWENESVMSQQSSFKIPNSRSAKSNNSLIGLKDTSVNVAAAFHAAQTGNFSTSSTSERPFASKSKHPSKSPAPPPTGRAKSPAEQLADSARALSPVRFFLRSTDDGDEYPSFSSLGSGQKSTDTSYDYHQEEEFVRQAQAQAQAQNAKTSANGHRRRISDAKRNKTKSKNEDLPYRPAEDDWQPESGESDGEGEGIVRSGALEGRAESRGQRKDKGEGYLGMGLGLQPRQRVKRPNGYEDEGQGEGEEDVDDGYSNREYTPGPAILEVQQTPNRSMNGYRRSPTPAQVLARALSPRTDRRSPAPPSQLHGSRKRQPSSLRTVITNILHGIALGLEFTVNLIAHILKGGLINPTRNLLGSGKDILRKIRANWWKLLVGALVFSLSLRLLDRPWRQNTPFTVPDLPPGSMEELISRLSHLEQAVSLLSDSSRLLAAAEQEGKKMDDSILSRVSQIEGSINAEAERLSAQQQDSKTMDKLHSSFDTLRNEVGDLSQQIGTTQRDWKDAKSKLDVIGGVQKEIQTLKSRVDNVETNVKSVLEDGRLRTALERILPHSIPVRLNKYGGIDIDPGFWTELRKVVVGKGEVESIVRSALASSSTSNNGNVKDGKELEAWGEKLIERKISDGVILTRADFAQVLEGEVLNLKHIIDALPRHAPLAPSGKAKKSQSSSPITIKTPKGDDVTSVLQDLIDAALLKYSKDTIAKPDFALFTAGARIVPSITSDTLLMRAPGVFGRWVLGRKAVEGRSPATAIHPDISVGSCWPFQGSQGQLGVLLNRRVVVSDITIEHAASEVALDVSTAPKEVEVWGMAEGEENKRKVTEYLESHPPSDSSIPPSPDHLLLGRFTYEPSSPSHIQTFPVDLDIVELGIDVGIVIFKINSNWGSDLTCLYRVRVHGEAVELDGAQ